MTRYTRNAKEVLRDGLHFADCIDDGAARLITDALNERKGMPQAQHSLPLDDNGPLFVEPPALVVLTSELIEREKTFIQRIGLDVSLDGDRSVTWVPILDPTPRQNHYRAPQAHSIRQENDEYACSCGKRWDIGEEHP